jgi:hypothetical protein
MRSLLALVVLAVVLVPAAAQERPRPTDRDVDGLVGPVKRVATFESTAGGPARPVESVAYDADGRLAERVVYAAGVEAGRILYTYDALGVRHIRTTTPVSVVLGPRPTRLRPRDLGAETFVRDSSGMFVFSSILTHDTAGRLINEAIHPGDDPAKTQLLARILYRYNTQGRLSERMRFFGVPGAPIDKQAFTYDADGRVTDVVDYKLSNALPTKRSFVYELDARGNWTTRTERVALTAQPIPVVTTRKIEYF